MQRIGLLDAVSAVRAELSESILAAANEELRFEVGEITLEFEVELERTGEGSGGIRFWVIELRAGASRTSTKTHRISIPLRPLAADGQPVLTGATTVPK